MSPPTGRESRVLRFKVQAGCPRVVRVFPNKASLLRLVSALLAENTEDSETGKLYLNTPPPESTGELMIRRRPRNRSGPGSGAGSR